MSHHHGVQTNGRPGNYNPHLHILVPAGGLDPQGLWKKIRFIPFDLLHRTWQYHLLTMLREQIDDPHIEPDIDHGFTHYPKGFVANVQHGDVPPGGKGLAEYLVSPPISVHRIERYDGHTVTYWYRDHRTQAIQPRISDLAMVLYRQDKSPRLDCWGSDVRSHTTEGDTQWVNYKPSPFSSPLMAF